MKGLSAMFVLTPSEQRLVIFVLLALVVGASIKHHREMKLSGFSENSAQSSPTPLMSPTPNERQEYDRNR
jgi:hypothetical protein